MPTLHLQVEPEPDCVSRAGTEQIVSRIGWVCIAATVIPSVAYLLALSIFSRPLSERFQLNSPISWAMICGISIAGLLVIVAGIYIVLVNRLERGRNDT